MCLALSHSILLDLLYYEETFTEEEERQVFVKVYLWTHSVNAYICASVSS